MVGSPCANRLRRDVGPRPGRSDAERNCISNVRGAGLTPDLAAFKLDWLLARALALGLTGVTLKDESDRALISGSPATALPGLPGTSG